MPILSMIVSISLRRNHVPDLVVDFREEHFGLFDARAGGRHGVQPHLPGIHRGEEIPSR